MNILKSFVWEEKYRPSELEDCILPSVILSKAKGWIENKDSVLANMTFCGGAGIGKTTLAILLCEKLGYEYIIINGSEEGRLIETVRNTITNFASSASIMSERKAIIIDEADGIPPLCQDALRNLMQTFHETCTFILTCNYVNKLSEPLLSRCPPTDFSITKSEKNAMITKAFTRIIKILNAEAIPFDKKVLVDFVIKQFPDFRKTINLLQQYSATGKIDDGIFSATQDNDVEYIIKFLKEKDFKTMRSWVATSSTLDLSVLCRNMYDKMYEYCVPTYMPQLVLTLAEWQYKTSFIIDKEIAIAAMLTEIMIYGEWK